MKKCLILTASLLLSIAAQAENCNSAELLLKSSSETKAACEALKLQGSAEIKACPDKGAELIVDAGGVYQMSANSQPWVSKFMSVYSDDESGQSETTIITIDLLSNSYYGKQITTDRRGHRSDIDCSGSIEIK